MNNSAEHVVEIFREAGTAFHKLSDMIMLLHNMDDSHPSGKWSEEEIEMLRSCVHQFAVDLNKLSLHIKNRSASQIRTTLKKKAFEDAGIPVLQVSSTPTFISVIPPEPHIPSPMRDINIQSVIGSNAEVTLNMLNASENEPELTPEVKLEFEPNTEEAE